MTSPESYILRWDFDKFRDQISDAKKSYTDFGKSLRDLVASVSGDFTTLQAKASAVTTMVGSLNPQLERSIQHIKEGTSSFSEMMNTVAQHGSKIASEVSRMKAAGGSAAGGSSAAMEQARGQIVLMMEGAAFAGASVEIAQENADKVIRVIHDTDKKSEEDVNRVKKYLQAEMESAASKVKEVAGHVPGGVLGSGIIGGLLGAMVLGYTEKDRLRAQRGEMLNVIEASGEAISSSSSRKVTQWFSNFQETAQWYYGISKEETQGVLKSMVDAGYKSKEIMSQFDSSLGSAGKHVGIMSIAMDKHFNQDTGTSINNIIKITTSLGDSLKEATDKYARIAFAGQQSAMGISKFTDAVISGASAMQQYGVDVAEVASIMGTIEKHYTKMGLNPQYAGNQASNFINGISQGLAGMDPSMKAMLAQRMFPELTGQDARQKWEDGFKRARQPGSEDFVTKTLLTMREWASEGGKTRSQAIRLMESKIGDNRTAAGLYDATAELAKGTKLAELSLEQQDLVKGALSTESEKVSDLAKLTRDLTNAVADIGQGLLKVLSGLVGAIILSLRYLPEIIQAALPGGDKDFLIKLNEKYDIMSASMSAGLGQASTGLKDAAKAMGREFGDDLKPIIDAVNWKAPTNGGRGMITSIEEAKSAFSELNADFMQIMGDEEFRRQLSNQAEMNRANIKAWFLKKLYALNASSMGQSFYGNFTDNPEKVAQESYSDWEDANVRAADLPDIIAEREKERYRKRAEENRSPELDEYQTEMPTSGGASAKVDGKLVQTATLNASKAKVSPNGGEF